MFAFSLGTLSNGESVGFLAKSNINNVILSLVIINDKLRVASLFIVDDVLIVQLWHLTRRYGMASLRHGRVITWVRKQSSATRSWEYLNSTKNNAAYQDKVSILTCLAGIVRKIQAVSIRASATLQRVARFESLT